MPYDMRKEGDGWVVVNTSNGKRFSSKPLPKDRAQNQMRALYAAEQEQITHKASGHTGAAVIVYMPQDVGTQLQAIARNALGPGVELLPVEELHVTLAYLGDSVELDAYNPGTKEKALRAVRKTAELYQQTVGDSGWCGSVNGFLRFFPLDEELGTPIAFTFDSSCMSNWRPRLVTMLESEEAYVDMSHGFVPHITIAYVPRYFPMPDIRFAPIDTTITELCLEWGEESNPVKLAAEAPSPHEPVDPSGSMSTYPASSFMVYKEADGTPRWLMVSSSSFRDRDREWVTSKALIEDEIRADLLTEVVGSDIGYGPLRWWHLGYPYLAVKGDWTSAVAGPGIDLGWCDFSATHSTEEGVSLVEGGTFVSKEVAAVVEANASILGASLTFAHPPDQPGRSKAFQDIRKVERSLLPQPHNSNLAAAFVSLIDSKEVGSMDQSKIDRLIGLGMSPAAVDRFLMDVTTRHKELRDQGIISKEASQGSGTDDNAAVLGALDSMAQGVLALKTYIESSSTSSKPKAKADAKAEDDMEDGEDSKGGKKPPFLKKETSSSDGDEALTVKQVNDMFVSFKAAFTSELKAVLEQAMGQVVAQAVQKIQADNQVTQKAVSDISTYLANLMGDMPPGASTPPSASTANVINPDHPLHQKEASGGNNGGTFAEGPFGWIDQKLGFGGGASTNASQAVPRV